MKTKHCISCDESISIDATFCPFCTAKQPDVRMEKEESDTANETNDIKKIEFPKRRDIKDVVVVENEKHQEISKEKKHQLEVEKQKEEKEEIENITYIAYHDELTGLHNRQAFKEVCETVSQKDICIGSVDVNNLKLTNDTFGHKYGDTLLKTVAEALAEVFGEDNVYRIGGDEFSVLLEGEREGVINGKIETFNNILKEKEDALPENEKYEIGASVGFAYGDGIKTISDILNEADGYMYESKRKSKEAPYETEVTEDMKPKNPISDGKYDPNADGYYDDVKVLEEAEDARLSTEVLLKSAGIIVGTIIAFIIFVTVI